jgi:curli biogenesis system outer membrane secretion channel CsgG
MAQQKKLVAVLDFDYGTVRSAVQAYFGSDQDVGKGISLMLEQKLVQDAKYRVIDRNSLDKILKEQNFSNSDRADSSSAAKLGRILGVSAIITGSITQFGRDDKHLGIGGGGYGGGFGRAIGGIHKNDSKAVVNVTAKLIDTNTGEILAAFTGTGESKRSGFGAGGGGGGYGGGGGGAIDMGSSNFGETILGEAVNSAVANLGQQLDDKADALPTSKIEFSGLIADVTGNTLVANIGTKAGVKVGDQVTISRKVKDVKDPATGAVIKSIVSQLGTATVTEADELSCTATFNGSGPVKVGDVVKSQ